MPKYKCNVCSTIKQMNKKPVDMFCDFCNMGEYLLIKGQEGLGARRRILGIVKEDEDDLEDSEDWI